MAAHVLPALPYDYEALAPYIDATTMNIHHTKHHNAYVTNLNGALDKHPELKGLSLVDIVKKADVPTDIATVVRNNGGGHYNHSFFWKVMAKPGSDNGPSAELKEAIDAAFGAVDEMKTKFNAAAAGRFGSGWAWLGVKADGSLGITSTPNQDNPLMSFADDKMTPILGLDVWEHAYYLQYQNRRPEYIAAWWNVVNWEQVSANFAVAKSGGIPQ